MGQGAQGVLEVQADPEVRVDQADLADLEDQEDLEDQVGLEGQEDQVIWIMSLSTIVAQKWECS